MNRHAAHDLKQMQSLPLETKIEMTKRRIAEWYDSWDGMVYVSFSGGKDSTVLKHIVDSMYDDVPSVFVNTGLEYPEIQKFARLQKNTKVIRPKMRFDEVIKRYGYPVVTKHVSSTVEGARNSIKKGVYSLRLCQLGVQRNEYGGLFDNQKYDYDKKVKNSKFACEKWRYLLDVDFAVSNYCCNIMKKDPLFKYEAETERKPIVATMAYESLNRENAWLKNGCNAFNAKSPKSAPMSFWAEQDVILFLKKYKVPYCSIYGEIIYKGKDGFEYKESLISDGVLGMSGCDRTGCIFCMFGCHLEKEPNRFQRLKETHPRQFEYCINGGEYVDGKWQPSKEGLGLGHVLDCIGVNYK